MKQHRSRHPVDVLPPLLTADPALDERAFRGLRGHALVNELDGQAGFVADRGREPPCRRGFRTVGGVEAQRQSDDDPGDLVAARDVREPLGQACFGLGRNRSERLGDGFGRVAQREADPFGVGEGVGVAVDGGATPCSTT